MLALAINCVTALRWSGCQPGSRLGAACAWPTISSSTAPPTDTTNEAFSEISISRALLLSPFRSPTRIMVYNGYREIGQGDNSAFPKLSFCFPPGFRRPRCVLHLSTDVGNISSISQNEINRPVRCQQTGGGGAKSCKIFYSSSFSYLSSLTSPSQCSSHQAD